MANQRITRAELLIGAFVAIYMLAFTVWFLVNGNYEFVVYILSMLVMIWLVARSLRVAEYPPALLGALSLWGLLHMAGGGIPVGGSVLYSLQLLPIMNRGEMILLKYDQVVHAYGFGVTAWLLWHLLARHFPDMRGTKTIYVYPVLGSMGLGCVNEIIEFSAVVAVPETNVGGYTNTALDLVFNGIGAVIAIYIISRRNRA